MMPLKIVAAAALVRPADQKLLLTQRPPGKAMAGWWEFPGGKLDAGESPEQALIRELEEELGIRVSPHALHPLTFASHAYDTFHLLMPLYGCRDWRNEPYGAEGQSIAWVSPDAMEGFPLLPADVPLMGIIRAWMRTA